MNILHVVLSLKFGGLEKVVLNLSERLNKGDFISMICCLEEKGDLYQEAISKDIDVVVLNKRKGIDFSILPKLIDILRSNNISIIHCHNPGAVFYGALAGFFARTRVILSTIHSREQKISTNMFWRFIWALNSKIIFVSNDARLQFSKYNKFKKLEKTSVIYNGIDLNIFRNYGEDSGGCQDSFIDSKKIGTVSRLSKEKDQKALIHSVKIVSEVTRNIKLVFIGDGPMRNELQEYSNEIGMKDDVLFFGFQKNINAILKNLDIFVLSSLTEGISLSLLEAMAASRPIVATSVGGNPEVVVNGETGLLVAPKNPEKMAEAILDLLNNPEKARRMGEAGRKRVEERFSLERMVEEYEKVYEEVLKKKGQATFSKKDVRG